MPNFSIKRLRFSTMWNYPNGQFISSYVLGSEPREDRIAEPSMRIMIFTQHRIDHATGWRTELVIRFHARIPLPIGRIENGAEEIRQGFVGSEDAEVSMVLIQAHDVAQESSQHDRVLTGHRAWRGHVHRVRVKIRHPEVAQQTAVRVRVGAHAAVALWRQLGEFRDETAVAVEQLLVFVALHPALELPHVQDRKLRAIGDRV